MRAWLAVAWLLAWSASPVRAAGLTVHLTDSHGRAASNAVVILTPARPAADVTPAPPPATHVIDQKDETFLPYVQLFRPGDKVVFRNSDDTRHHVYSFSPIRKFEFVLRPGQSSLPLQLDQAGIAAVGCNIHDHMISYLFVSAAPLIALSDRSGDASFARLAPGRYTAQVWHPQLYPGQPQPSQPVTIADGAGTQTLSFTLSLIPDPRMPMDRGRLDY